MPVFLTDKDEIYDLYKESQDESKIWRKDYQEYERLADNELMDGLDENLPEVNDGSLAAALFKLPKRIVNSKLTVKFKALDRDEAWVSELANIVWEKQIVPNANSQAPFYRKLKDAVRKAAIYGSVAFITLLVERGDYTGADFIVSNQPQDVKLEPGKVSDSDSDIIFWDVYFSKLQVRNMIERAKEEQAEAKESGEDGYNKWFIPVLEKALDDNAQDEREGTEDNNVFNENGGARPKGIKFFITQQRGVDSPFCMYYRNKNNPAREWSNPDPTGDIGIHMLYCYQDLINPYGIGIVKLAGGTQNVLDYMRQADVLATQIGLRPPIAISGDTTNTDFDSMVYEQDAQWYVGNAQVERQEISTQIYQELPNRTQMYKSSLNNLIPMGDTSVSAEAGDPLQSKTPAGVKLAAANLSIDDEDFKDNFYQTFTALARNMVNTHFANMQGSDIMKLSDEDRDRLMKAGLEFPVDENGQPTNELEVIWDESRASFEAEVEAESDKTTDEAQRLEGLTNVWNMITNPQSMQLIATGQPLMLGTKKLDPGELAGEIISLSTDNDKILTDVDPEEQAMAEEQAMMAGGQAALPGQPVDPDMAHDATEAGPEEYPEEGQDQMAEEQIVQGIMQQYGVDEGTARAMRAAELQGFSPEEIMQKLQRDAGGAQ